MTAPDQIASLITSRQPGHALPQAFYDDADVFLQDLNVLDECWQLVDHESRIPNPGDYFLVQVGPDSYIVVRGHDGVVRALHNVCRHRGSRVCLEEAGNSRLFVCPYHAWSYKTDGSLHVAREMPVSFAPDNHGLSELGCQVRGGLIFISPHASADVFDDEFGDFEATLDFHGMAHTKVAVRRTYPTQANWKLVVENFLECYHCVPAHPEYTAVHSREKLAAFGAGPGSGDPEAVARFQPRMEQWAALAHEFGHPVPFSEGDHTTSHMAQFARVPLSMDNTQLSETKDGSLACTKLLGSFTQSDGGQTGFAFSPTSYVLASCDYAIMLTFRPLGPDSTDVDARWLVHNEAIEGEHYDIDKLTWVWDTTLAQDKTITENNQLGVSSRGYQPGPYALSEARTATFIDWYLRLLGQVTPTGVHRP